MEKVTQEHGTRWGLFSCLSVPQTLDQSTLTATTPHLLQGPLPPPATFSASFRLLSGPPKLSGALGKAPSAEPAGGTAPEGVGRDPIIPTPGDPSPRSPVCSPPSGENPAFPEAGLPASAGAHVALGPRPHPQRPVSTCLAGPGSRGPRSSGLPGPGPQLALLHRCGRPGGPQADRPPQEARPLPAQPPLAS
ncbi:collagen alpha-1(X) chain-like [Pseudorca crassidens]|uniref:collagen alpha-1(X) chain-like n=1 Tax=Pseudorca crassidens TaxID=82174 RepID=UPI00352EA037